MIPICKLRRNTVAECQNALKDLYCIQYFKRLPNEACINSEDYTDIEIRSEFKANNEIAQQCLRFITTALYDFKAYPTHSFTKFGNLARTNGDLSEYILKMTKDYAEITKEVLEVHNFETVYYGDEVKKTIISANTLIKNFQKNPGLLPKKLTGIGSGILDDVVTKPKKALEELD